MPLAPASAPMTFPSAQHDISATIPNLITPNLIEKSPSQAAGALVTLLTENAQSTLTLRPTSPNDRLDVVQRMMQYGTPAYLAAFTSLVHGREILATWLSDATPPRKADAQDTSELYVNVVGPLLELLLRLPIELDHLKDHVGLGKLITGAQKRLRNEQARKLADTVKEKWSALVPASSVQRDKTPPPTSAVANATAKRPAASTAVQDPAAKRARSATPTLASRTGAGVRPSTNLLTSSSSRQTTRSSSRTSSAQSNASKDLASFMTLIDQQPSTPPSIGAQTPPSEVTAASSGPEPKKRKKSVHWKDYDGQVLVAVKLIEPAIYDEDDQGGMASVGQLDMEEGGAFRMAHADMEEYIDYYPPFSLDLSVVVPIKHNMPERGAQSKSKFTQEDYEHAVPEAVYEDTTKIPDSPAEPTPDDYLSAFSTTLNDPRNMKTGSVIRPFVFDNVTTTSKNSAIPGLPPNLADLLLQLKKDNAQTVNDANVQPPQMTGAPSSDVTPVMPAIPQPPWNPGMSGGPPWPFPFPPPEAMAAMQPSGAAPINTPPPSLGVGVNAPDHHDRRSSDSHRSRGGRGRRNSKHARSG